MDACQLALIVSVVVLGIVVFYLSRALVLTNRDLARFGGKAIDHAMGFSDEQREMMRIRFEADHQEFLLREARAKAAKQYVTDNPPVDPPMPGPDIMVDATGNSTLN